MGAFSKITDRELFTDDRAEPRIVTAPLLPINESGWSGPREMVPLFPQNHFAIESGMRERIEK
jgi:hypothetical protein